MPMHFKVDVLKELKNAGYSTFIIRKGKIISEGTLQRIRDGKMVSIDVIEKLCELLDMQPGDLIKYTREDA